MNDICTEPKNGFGAQARFMGFVVSCSNDADEMHGEGIIIESGCAIDPAAAGTVSNGGAINVMSLISSIFAISTLRESLH